MGEDSDTVGEVFGWIGSVISIVFFFMPIAQFIDLIKGKITYKDVAGLLLLCTVVNCELWVVYGIKLSKLQVYITNGTGVVVTYVWIIIFLVYFSNKNPLKSTGFVLLALVVIAGIAALFYLVVDSARDEAVITGYVAMVFNVLMYAAPGEKVYRVIKTGNYQLIPIFSTIGALVNSCCWTIYGIYDKDVDILVPNALGLFFAILQIIVYLAVKYKKGKSKENPQEAENVEKKPESEKDENGDKKPDSEKNENDEKKPDSERQVVIEVQPKKS